MTDKPFQYFDTFRPMILTDLVIPRDYFSAPESWFPEIHAKAQEQRLGIVKEFTKVEVVAFTPGHRDLPKTGDRLQMLADVDAVEFTPATRYAETAQRVRKLFSDLIRQDMEKRLMRAIKGEN